MRRKSENSETTKNSKLRGKLQNWLKMGKMQKLGKTRKIRKFGKRKK